MNKLAAALITAAFLSTVGCATAPVPVPVGYEKSTQPKMLAAHHWDTLAGDVAQRLQTALSSLPQAQQNQVLFVDRPSRGTVFSSSFTGLLETQLMGQGFGITRVPETADFIVEYDVTYAGNADYPVGRRPIGIEPPDDDIIVTVAVLNGNRYVTRLNDIFYIEARNNKEYFASTPIPNRAISVVGP